VVVEQRVELLVARGRRGLDVVEVDVDLGVPRRGLVRGVDADCSVTVSGIGVGVAEVLRYTVLGWEAISCSTSSTTSSRISSLIASSSVASYASE